MKRTGRLRLVALHLRATAWSLWWFVTNPAPIAFPQPPEGPQHPSALCQCGDVTHDAHQPSCEWGRVLCKPCMGTGHCPTCWGDGIDPKAEDVKP